MTQLGGILSQRRYALTAVLALVAYAILYLAAAQLLVWQPDVAYPGIEVSDNWRALLFRERAPYLYEPIGVVALAPSLALYLAVPNLAIALVLGALVGLNAAVSYHGLRALALRGASGFVSLLGAIPSLIGGAACCVPTLVLVIGLQMSATLVAVWPLFVPASALLLVAALWWLLAHRPATAACEYR